MHSNRIAVTLRLGKAALFPDPHRQPRAYNRWPMSSAETARPKRTLDKWANCHVGAYREPGATAVHEFGRVVTDAADERPVQTFLAARPILLGPLTPPGGDFWCLDRPRFGAEWVPDF